MPANVDDSFREYYRWYPLKILVSRAAVRIGLLWDKYVGYPRLIGRQPSSIVYLYSAVLWDARIKLYAIAARLSELKARREKLDGQRPSTDATVSESIAVQLEQFDLWKRGVAFQEVCRKLQAKIFFELLKDVDAIPSRSWPKIVEIVGEATDDDTFFRLVRAAAPVFIPCMLDNEREGITARRVVEMMDSLLFFPNEIAEKRDATGLCCTFLHPDCVSEELSSERRDPAG